MKFRPQLKVVAWGVSFALMASTATMPAFAGGWGAPTQGDSGQGVDTVIGNGLNPRGLDTTVQPDDNGLGPFHSPVAHTPTGAQYSVPWTEPTDPSFYGDVEFGYIGSFGDANASKFVEYRDFSGLTGSNNGLTINNFNFGTEKNGHYFNFSGGGVGNKDQYYTGAIGSYNDWRLRFFYNETPHVFETNAKLIWSGAGTNTLTLLPQYEQNLVAAGGTNSNTTSATVGTQTPNAAYVNTALRNTIAQVSDSTIALYRKKGGMRWDMPINDKWSYYASYSVERRTGDRDYGQTGGGFPGAALTTANGGNGQPIEVVEPIDYTTHEIATGTGYVDDKNALNLSLTASIFQDAIKDVYWQDPDVSPYYASAATQTLGQVMNRTWQNFTTPPDNQAYNLSLDYTRALGFWNGNLSSNFSVGRQNQNDQLQPYTVATGANATTPQGSMALWNSDYATVNGVTYQTMSRLTSELHNNLSMANIGLNLQPTDKLSVSGKLRYYGVHNDNDYISCNPALAAAYNTTCSSGVIGSNITTVNINGVTYTPTVNTAGALAPIYGYMGEDGNNTDLSSLTGGGNRIANLDASWHQFNGGLNADYQLASKTSLNFSYERENVNRAERERAWTFEDKFKIGLVDRGLGAGTLRASYEYDDRKGSAYRWQPYLESFCADTSLTYATTCLGTTTTPAVTANPVLGTKYDLSDRKQSTVVLRYNYAFTETLDAMLTGKLNHQNYPDPLGRGIRNEQNVSAELNWTPDTLTTVYADLTYEGAKQTQASAAAYYSNCTSFPCSYVVGGTNSYFGLMGTDATTINTFKYTEADKDWYFNLGANHKFAAVRVDVSYTYTHTQSPIDYYAYNYLTGTQSTTSNFQFPDIVWNRHQLNLNATMPINEKVAVHVLYMFDKAYAADWHYDGLSSVADSTGAGRYYLNSTGTEGSYTAQVVAIFAQYKM